MRTGFGTRVMDSMIRGQLKGQVSFDWHAEGLACEIGLLAADCPSRQNPNIICISDVVGTMEFPGQLANFER